MVHVVGALIAYTYQPKKPSLNLWREASGLSAVVSSYPELRLTYDIRGHRHKTRHDAKVIVVSLAKGAFHGSGHAVKRGM